ncbi:hypothetical protein [uncultured Streptococcus sp.]|uniref:hypothetical protein n=1 Tax=uncultured Streptococcus sp. TaxID=83427 RepID=UPI0028D34FD9|nr:hypothetical protein [uncultured Streptococcus sp.]
MEIQLLFILLLISFSIFLLIRKSVMAKKFTDFLISNRGQEINFIESGDLSVLECAKILNKKYKIGLINSYIVVNSIKVR